MFYKYFHDYYDKTNLFDRRAVPADAAERECPAAAPRGAQCPVPGGRPRRTLRAA